MIPKIIHYVWFGQNNFGEIEKKCMQSWKKILPDYEFMFWGNDCIDQFDNPYFKEAIANKKYAFASDYVRLYALYKYGGIYLDTDEEILKPLDEFLHHDFFVGCENCGTAKGISTALVGAVPHNQIIKDLLDVYDNINFIKKDGSFNLVPNNGYFNQVLTEKYYLKNNFLKSGYDEFAFNSFLYNYYYFGKENKTSYAVHHCTGSWLPDWKISDKLRLKLGKNTYVLRKYKRRRESPFPLECAESIICKCKTSKRSTLTIVKKTNVSKQIENEELERELKKISMPKIAFFCDYFITGGVERVLVTVCNTLVESGYDVAIVWTGYVEDNFLRQQLNSKIKQINMAKELRIKSSLKPQGSWFKRNIWKIRRTISLYKLHNINKYISDFYEYDYLIDFRNGESKITHLQATAFQKKVVWIHGSHALYCKSRLIKKNSILQYDKIICLTDEFKEQFIKNYPKHKNKIIRLYNAFDIEDIKAKSILQNDDIIKYQPYFLCVSRLSKDKDIFTILKACELFYSRFEAKSKMIFVGDGPLKQEFSDWVKARNLEDNIFFIGCSFNPYSWMKNAQALIMSSKNEGLPSVLIEGQICGALCISNDCPNGPKEILEGGKSGILFDIGDYKKLAQIMSDVENGNVNSSEIIANLARSISRFSKDSFVCSFDRVFGNA